MDWVNFAQMKYRMYLYFGAMLTLAANLGGQSLPLEAHFNRYTMTEGLPSNNIYSIEQDDNGFIWIGTDAGLSCFDGVHFTNYTKGKDRRLSLPSNAVTQLLKLPNGKIALATRFGLCLLDPVKRSFKSAWIPCEPEMEVAINGNHPVVLTSRGHLVTGGSAGFSVFDTALNVVFHYAHYKKEDLNITRMGFTHDLMALANGDVLIRGWDGFWRYDATENCVEKQDPQAFGEADLQRFHYSGKANISIWRPAFPDSITLRNLQTGEASTTRLSKENKYELHWRSTLRFVNDTLLGFSCYNFGFRTAVCDPKTLQLHISKNLIFPKLHFHSFFLDREGRWWLASENGLFVQSFSKSRFRFASVPTGVGDEGAPNPISAIVKAGDNFYVGAARALLVLDKNLKLLKYVTAPAELMHIWNLQHWQPGILDVGGSDAWMRLHIPRQWNEPLQWEKIGAVQATISQVKDLSGDIWVGTYTGLLRYNPSTGKKYYYAKGQPDGEFPFQGALRTIRTDSGYIWMCGLPGFTRWNPFSQQFDRHFPRALGTEREEGYPSSLASNGGEELLFVLNNNGLWRWSGDASPAQKVETGSPALDFILEIYPDTHPHRFWLLLKSGLALLDVATNQYSYLTVADGMPDQPIMDDCFYLDPTTDSVYCCYPNGILAFSRKDFDFSKRAAPIFISAVTQISSGKALDAAVRLQLKQPGNDIAISFGSPDFEQGRLLTYAYRLNGGVWQSLGSSKSVRFVSLAPGRYLFEVKSITPEGVGSEPERLVFEVMPHFYQTWWFGVLMFAALALAAFGYFRWRLGQLRKMEAMRQAIAADLHDEVGASLTSIQILAQLASHPDSDRRSEALEKLPEQVRRISTSLREIVWNISPSHDSLGLLIGELSRYAGEVFEKLDIQYSIHADDFPDTATLDMVARQHLQRIFKESLNNLAKHSQASRAAVVFKKEGNELVMQVRDNGLGFDPATVRRGNGLDNMQARAMAAGGQLTLRSSPTEGTETTLRLPLKAKKGWWKIFTK